MDQRVAAAEIRMEAVFLDHVATRKKWKTHPLLEQRILLHGDVSSRTAKKLAMSVTKAISVLDVTLLELPAKLPEESSESLPPAKRILHAVVLKSQKRYQALLEALLKVAPPWQKDFLERSSYRSGFLLQRPPLVVVLSDSGQAEARLEHSLAHDLASPLDPKTTS